MSLNKPYLSGVRLGNWAKLFSARPDIFLIHNTGGGGVINAVTGEYVVNQDYTKANGPFGEEINTSNSTNIINLQITNEAGFTCITFVRYLNSGKDHRLFGYPGQTPSAWADTIVASLRSTSFSGTTVNGPNLELGTTIPGYKGVNGYHCWGVTMASGDPTSGNFVNGVKSATGNPGTWTPSNLLQLYSDGSNKTSDALYIWTIAFNEKIPDAEIEYITANPEQIYSILDLNYKAVKAPSGIVLPFDLGSKLGFGLVKQKKNFTAQTLVSPPIVSAGADVSGEQNTPIQLLSTVTPGTDANPSYFWSIVSGGTGTFIFDNEVSPTFTPDNLGVYVLQLSVSTTDWIAIIDTVSVTSTVVLPILSNAIGTTTGATTASGSVMSDTQNGILDEVTTRFINTPSALQIKALQDHLGDPVDANIQVPINQASATTNFNVSGLQSGITFYHHQVQTDDNSDESIPVTSNAFTTTVIVAPTITAGGPYTGDAGVAGAVLGVLTPGTDPSPVILWDVISGGTGVFSAPNNVSSNFTPTIGVESRITIRITATPNDGNPVSAITTFTTSGYVPPPDDTFEGRKLAYYQVNGAVSSQIDTAEKEFLVAQIDVTLKTADNATMWNEMLRARGYVGIMSGMRIQFWKFVGVKP